VFLSHRCEGGALYAAYDGNPLDTMAKIKEQIMLNGGVITSMAMSAGAFTNFVANKTAANAVFAVSEDLRSAAPAVVAMHAVFCYGWWDNPRNINDGYWLCKNRWGGTSRGGMACKEGSHYSYTARQSMQAGVSAHDQDTFQMRLLLSCNLNHNVECAVAAVVTCSSKRLWRNNDACSWASIWIMSCFVACSWGPSWGLKGSFRMAYGAANIMQPDYTFALEYNAASMAARAWQVVRRLQPGTTNISSSATADEWRFGYLAYTPKTPLRLAKLAVDLSVLAATALSSAVRLRKADILTDLVASNLGYLPSLSAASTGPFRLSGKTAHMLSSVLLPTRPSPSPVLLPSPSPMPVSPSPSPSPLPSPLPGECYSNMWHRIGTQCSVFV
jgi:hypothetical protein